jgi:hypothetical protein
MQLRQRATGFVRTEGGLLPPDLLERVRRVDRKLPGLDEAAYGLRRGERFGEAITRSWNNLVGDWATLRRELATVGADDPGTTPTRERWLLPLFEELGYGRLASSRAVEIEGKAYPVSHAFALIPLHLVGANVPLDRRSRGVAGAAGQSPHGLVQELLNRSPERLWGIVTNGRVLRLLRDNASLTRQAYLEFDLEAIFDGEAYADFALLWHVAHRTRLEPRLLEGAEEGSGPRPDGSYIERWTKVAAEEGTRARDRLRDGVQEAIEALGQGFLAHPANGALRAALKSGELTTQDYYRELLRLVYRLILLFVAEDRDLLLDPHASAEARGRYVRYYSTARLRRLAERRRGTRHADLYTALRVVIAALGRDEGAPGIALPALGGFLFGSDACRHLDAGELANADLLAAVRKLATIEERAVLRAVDYRNLGSEELGSIYESLLELHPELDADVASFALHTAPGHERKTTGSYYTPSSLISVLLDSALDPVLAEAADKPTKAEAERAILDLKVVDPAAGSGHFLVAAAHRIAKRLASVRTGDEEPAPEAISTALRDVIGHCLYAVDINPMAVELCKVSLWLEALDPGRPLSFLDAHVKCGNSLLGTTPELIAQGIPDAAYDPIEGDDKAVAAALKKRNRAEREGQLALGEAPIRQLEGELAERLGALDVLPDTDTRAVREKEREYGAILESPAYREAKLLADAWCAAFVAFKVDGGPEITTSTLRRLARDPASVRRQALDAAIHLAAENLFFHWHLEFPDVLVRHGRPGFNVVLGNPPWERVKLQEQEFFAERSPTIASARNAAERKRMIADLKQTAPQLWQAFQDALRRSGGESHLLRNSERYPLTGRGDINTYAVFAELMRSVIGPQGRQGVILPTGIATDDTTRFFFKDLVERRALISLFSFENEEFVFPAVHHAYRFCLLTLGAAGAAPSSDLVFYARQVTDLADADRHFSLTPEEFELLNPNTRTCPTFRSRRDAELAKSVYRRLPMLVDESKGEAGNPWGVSFMAMFHMANDSGLFFDEPGTDRLPLYEGKLVHQFTHRWATYDGEQTRDMTAEELRDPERFSTPRYWIDRREVEARLEGRWRREWLLAFRDVTGAEKVRTVIAGVIPRVGVGHGAPILLSDDPHFPLFIANLNAFVFDWQARQKVGGIHLTYGVFEQLPVLPPESYEQVPHWSTQPLADWLGPYVAELIYTAIDVRPFVVDLGWEGPPFVWDAERRGRARAELDAAFFHLYGLSRDQVDHVMESFWIVRDRDEAEHGSYRTKERILEAFDAMAVASPDSPFVSRLDPPPGDPRVAHPPREGGQPGRWRKADAAGSGSQRTSSERRAARPLVFGQPTSAPRTVDSAAGQVSLADLVPIDAGGWVSESAIDPMSIEAGERVRHPGFGEGTVAWVRTRGHSTTLVVNFGAEPREILFGMGMLEFAQKVGR